MGRVSDAKEKLMEAVTELIWHGSYGSTTVDQICQKAAVKKGSFYHFFDSKSDLAATALRASWQCQKTELDSIFSPTVPPLERIRLFCERCLHKQADIKRQCGCVLGCPLFVLGAEVCHQEAELHAEIKGIFSQYHQYLESAIRDANAAGLVDAPDSAARARMVFAYCEGLLTQARILNNLAVLDEMADGVFAILRRTRMKKAA